jgi:hypothetical protein
MKWGYRLLKTKDGDNDFYQIHEVYYDKDGKVDGYTANAVTVGGHSKAEVRWVLEQMLEALNKEPIAN